MTTENKTIAKQPFILEEHITNLLWSSRSSRDSDHAAITLTQEAYDEPLDRHRGFCASWLVALPVLHWPWIYV